MIHRRNFLKSTAAVAAGSMIFPFSSCSGPKEKVIGLQLYTVRDKLNQDFDGTLQRLASIGYNSLEAAGYNLADGTFYGMAPNVFSEKVKALGMPLNGSHSVFELVDAEKVFTNAAEAGCPNVMYAYLPEEFRQNIDGYKATAEKFNQIGEVGKKFGIRFGYHNHAFEFEPMGGKNGMEVLIEETDPALVTFEIDLYWVTRAGLNPVDFIKKYPGRFEIYHVKDMVKSEDMFFAPVGTGRIDFERIFAVKDIAGMKLLFVEQDRFRDYDPFDSVELSYNYLANASFV